MQRVKRRIFSGVVCEQEVYTVSDRANIKKAEPRPRIKDDEERAQHRIGISKRKHQRLVNENFSPLSLYSTLTFDDDSEVHTFSEARRIRDNYFRRLQRDIRKLEEGRMHKHLTWTDRLKIEKGLKEGLKPCAIADRLHVHNTTIYRELKRGRYTHLNSDLTTEERYSPEIAQQRYEENLKAKGGELKIGEEGYSPAAVVGEIKRLGLTFKTEISEKTIYNYIDKGIFYGISRESLPEHGERKRKYDKVERKKAARAPQGESIEERPQEINDRQTFGHWEGDCVCGKKRTKETLFVLSERLTRNEIIIKMPDQTAASVVAALNKLERRFGKKFSQIFKSITFDNGSEFMDCAGIEKSVYGKDRKRTKVYYCHPYSAYERGTNENINKMIRRFLPKGTDFRKVTAAYIQRVETWINNYPREILGFETSGSLFERYVAEAA